MARAGTHRPRSIRGLIHAATEAPLQPLGERAERRHYHRYDGHARPGFLTALRAHGPVQCLDIGYGGLKVRSAGLVPVSSGERVLVRFEEHGLTFQSDLSVRQVEYGRETTTLHLAF